MMTNLLSAFGCAICFGDPNSLQVKGAKAGVLFLMVVVLCVVTAILATAVVWARRASQLRKQV